MLKIAIVFGTSTEGINLSKQMLVSFYRNIYDGKRQRQIDLYPYICNYRVTNLQSLSDFSNRKQHIPSGFVYDKPPSNYLSLFDELHSFWPGNIYVKNTIDHNFEQFYLPDVAVYHNFACKHADGYDLVLYCHNDIVFTYNKDVLAKWIDILSYDSKYSIIAELRAIANQDISMRFHCCFILTNPKKFKESGLSFINELELIDHSKYHSYPNGGGGLLASFYSKAKNKKWQPYLLDTHGTYVDFDIRTKDKWFDHFAGIEWNKEMTMSEGGSPMRSKLYYEQAKVYVEEFFETSV